MPRIPQIVAQDLASGQVQRAPAVAGVDLSGPVAAANSFAQAESDLRQVQERAALKVADDEARMSAANLSSRASATWAERMEQAKNTAGAGSAGFTESTLKDFDAWSQEQIKALPEKARKYGEREMLQFRNGLHADAFKFEIKARNDKLVSDFSDGLDDDRKAVFAQPSQFSVILAKRRAAAETLDLPEEVRRKMVDASREALAYDAASAMVERNPDGLLEAIGVRGAKVGKDGKMAPQDEARAADAVKNDPILSSLSPEKLRSVVDRATMISETRKAAAAADAERRARMAEIEAARRAREADQAWKVLSEWSAAGKVADESNPEVKQMIGKLSGTPYASGFVELQRTAAAGAAVASTPIPQQRSELDALMARRNQNGTSPALENEIKRRESILTSSQKEYAEDPMRAALERNVFGRQGLAPVDVSSVDALVATVAPRLNQSQTVNQITGKPVSPLTADEAYQFSQMLSSMPAAQRASAVASLGTRLGPQAASGLAAQIDKKDKALALSLQYGASRTTEGRYTSEILLKGDAALKDKAIKVDSDKEAGWRTTITKEVGEAYPNENQRKDVIEAAYLINAGLAAEGKADPSRAVRLATRGGIVDVNGRPIPVPAGIDQNAIEKRLRQITAADFSGQAPDGKVKVGSTTLPIDDVAKAMPDAQLMYAREGQYYVLHGNRIVTNTANKPLVIKVVPDAR